MEVDQEFSLPPSDHEPSQIDPIVEVSASVQQSAINVVTEEIRSVQTESTESSSDLPSTSSRQSVAAVGDSISSTDDRTSDRNDVGLYIGKLNELSDYKKHQLLTNHWVPPKTYRYPYSEHNKQEKRLRRYFNPHHLDEFKWLVFSDHGQGLFCKICVLFAVEPSRTSFGNLVKSPLVKFAKLTGKDGALTIHAGTKYHETATLVAHDFEKNYVNPGDNIINQVSTARHNQVTENRARLRPIIETIKLCGRQNLPLRGHRDDGNVLEQDLTVNDGNFRAILRYRVAGGDTILEQHLRTASSKATYISKTTQNSLIECFKKEIQDVILTKVRAAGPYAVIFDETTDVAGREQLSFSIRYVHDNEIREDFVCFIDAYEKASEFDVNQTEVKLTGEALGRLVVNLLLQFDLDPLICVGAGVDSCAVMSSELKGAVAEMKKICKNIRRCPCFNHALNNSLARTSNVSQARNSVSHMKSLIRFCNLSAKRQFVFKKHLEGHFSGLCETRWAEKHNGIMQFEEKLQNIVNALTEIAAWSDPKSASEAKSLVSSIDAEFIVCVCTLSSILSITRPLSPSSDYIA